MFRLIAFSMLYFSASTTALAAQCYQNFGVDFTSSYSQVYEMPNNLTMSVTITKDGESLLELDKIQKEVGIEKYFEGALSGLYPLEFQGMKEKINALDLALMRKEDISPDIISRFKALGLKPSIFYWAPTFASPATDRLALFKEYLSWGNNINDLTISDLNIGNYALNKGNVELLRQFMNHGGDLYEGFLTDTSTLSLEKRLAFASLVDFDHYNKQYKKQQDEKHIVDQIPVNNPDFTFLNICENLDDWAVNNIKHDWTVPLDDIQNVINQAKEDCPKTVLACIQKANPIVAEVYMRREYRKKLGDKKIKHIKTIEEFHQLEKNQIGSFSWVDANNTGGFFYEKLLKDQTLHQHLIKNDKALTLYRLDEIGRIIADDKGLTEYLFKALPDVKGEIYLGKNLAYYVTLYSDNANYLKWYYPRYGEVKRQYGLSHYTYSSIRAIQYSEFNERLKMYKKMGYQETEFDRVFKQQLFH
ncbi:hypothetical protein AADZ91_05660 [Colwelliaceae bacterium 6441]